MCFIATPKKYKSENGYFKHFNSQGIPCRIKVSKNALKKVNTNFTVKFKKKNEEVWMVHIPNKKFKCVNEVIVFILKNLESENMVFKII